MLVFKPRLALFYVISVVIIALVTNRLTISTSKAQADIVTSTNVETCHP